MSAPESDEPRVSSALIFDQVRLLREFYGADVVARAEAALPAALREELDALSPGGWISLDAARELKNGVAALAGEDPLALQRRVCRHGVERTLTTVWRFLLRQLSDAALSKRTPIIYARSFNRGTLTLVAWHEGSAELELHGWPRMPDYDLVGLMTGVQTVLELAGRKEVKVTSARRAPLVLLHARWGGR
ncbi:MAG: hypothetical protein ACLQVI_21950 [Polyangiaceae bacterium]